MEHVLRQCLIALRIGDALGLGRDDRSIVYYTARAAAATAGSVTDEGDAHALTDGGSSAKSPRSGSSAQSGRLFSS
jgi:hypothetical protein